MMLDYLRDPGAIYAQSFAAIRAEADLSGFDLSLEPVVVRMMHAVGMTDLAPDIRASVDAVDSIRAALLRSAPILCDCRMVRDGVARRALHGSELLLTLNEPTVPDLAARLGTTRSAAAVELWRDKLLGAIVLIGNAPTALFHLLELLDAGVGKPAAIIATPVGFVGAAESKAELVRDSRGVPYITLLGRRGGSAMASAALNAIALEIA